MDQGQAAPPAQAAATVAPLVLPAPLLPLLAVPAVPAPPAFALGPGHSHVILNFDNPNTGAMATKLYNKAISPLEPHGTFSLTMDRSPLKTQGHTQWHDLHQNPGFQVIKILLPSTQEYC